ncbi:putative membrane or tegument protein [Vombatid gammaherpesvirus 1]|uniref:Putative membrane or tegument protein n=1 Tax=Vombatid gammaherpesvirus 1 TaxID=2052651 RepID=A0A3S8D7D0_9GAMA|nr:putative membrane or tegument protein [Vombatid gammaherpesvirus 1]AZB49120.1 putative membrane or tegument protein [Vombatid gammaherpesvirus 1]
MSTGGLSSLPDYCKLRGKRAHVRFYKRLLKIKRPSTFFKFIGLSKPGKHVTDLELFFEVNLYKRIVDCIALIKTEKCNTCLVLELKTCAADSLDLCRKIRAQQRLEGLNQLLDSSRIICRDAPLGEERWIVTPVLLFKAQKTLKTVYIEHPSFLSDVIVNSNFPRLKAFFQGRQDKSLFRGLCKVATCGESGVRKIKNNAASQGVGKCCKKGKYSVTERVPREGCDLSPTSGRDTKSSMVTSLSKRQKGRKPIKKETVAVRVRRVGSETNRQLSQAPKRSRPTGRTRTRNVSRNGGGMRRHAHRGQER